MAELLLFFICCLLVPSTKADLLGTEKRFHPDSLQKNIHVRLLKRDWKPLGPSASTDEVLEEYKWDVDTAFTSLRKSSWEYEASWVAESKKLFTSADYNKDLPMILIIHPVFGSADVFFVKTSVTALTMRNLHKEYNIFAIDMPKNNIFMLFSIWKILMGKRTYLKPMSDALSRFLVEGIDGGYLKPEQINLVGWSYSGQLVGYMGRHIYDKYNSKIASIVSLDPFSNSLNSDLIEVSAADAHIVHIFHTNTLLAGTASKIGTVDIVYNNGIIQPECRGKELLRNTIKTPNLCSHMKAVQRFWYLILYPSKFVGVRCPSWNRFVDCYCDEEKTATFTYPIKPNTKAEGTYFLRTLGHKPYGLGKEGVSCSSEKRLFMAFNKGTFLADDKHQNGPIH